jgi:hypothetical protein
MRIAATSLSVLPPAHNRMPIVSPNGCRLIDLRLGPIALAFVGAGSKEQIARVNTLALAHGEDWPGVWLRERGLSAVSLARNTRETVDA